MSLTGSAEWPPKRERAFSVADHGYANRTSFANNDPASRGTEEEANNGLSQDFSDKKPPGVFLRLPLITSQHLD